MQRTSIWLRRPLRLTTKNRSISNIPNRPLTNVDTLHMPISSPDTLETFRETAFKKGTPLRFRSNPRTGTEIGRQYPRSECTPLPEALDWFSSTTSKEPNRNESTTNTFAFSATGKLVRDPLVVLPYELVVAENNEAGQTNMYQLEMFRDYLHHRWLGNFTDIDLACFLPVEAFEITEPGTRFFRFDAPLQLMIEADRLANLDGKILMPGLYIAQAQIISLPPSIRDCLPTPLLTKAGKGDIYDANFWLGMAPTYTPLHKDPNQNLFIQIAGHKNVRLFRPDLGKGIFDEIQATLQRHGSAAMRGEEMMQGPERTLLHDAVWNYSPQEGAFQTILDMGDTLYIPQGWWHSVKGVSKGLNCSVNWWFR
jgi:hypothetical protein